MAAWKRRVRVLALMLKVRASSSSVTGLCADNRNLASGEDWLRAILSYNNSLDHAKAVYGFAQRYARDAQGPS